MLLFAGSDEHDLNWLGSGDLSLLWLVMPQVPENRSILDGLLGNGDALFTQEGELLYRGELVGLVDAILGDHFGEGLEILARLQIP